MLCQGHSELILANYSLDPYFRQKEEGKKVSLNSKFVEDILEFYG